MDCSLALPVCSLTQQERTHKFPPARGLNHLVKEYCIRDKQKCKVLWKVWNPSLQTSLKRLARWRRWTCRCRHKWSQRRPEALRK
ncbi:hypothetical protein CYMTET_27816 [Cymbomonas tetramitiformis]|uniref:Uncharacterized protein n=1 Tax=Cymbomonas tetramitiformis TaxID=36881 RepID=A0AAE0KWT1_9CHLO|nr:hypothetical protein CYMTET_27816 [Cymbomonas tetramitiformis]